MATNDDLPKITEIYQQGTKEECSYDYPDEKNLRENRKNCFAEHSAAYPVFVAEENKSITGWISLNAFDERRFL